MGWRAVLLGAHRDLTFTTPGLPGVGIDPQWLAVRKLRLRELDQLDDEARAARLAEIENHFHHMESPFLTAEQFRIPDIIDPRDTRMLLNEWLDDAGTLAEPTRYQIADI